MKTELLTLCDAAQEYIGKCVIVGTFNEFSSESFPAMIPNVSLVFRIAFEPNEYIDSNIIIKAYNVADPDFPIVNLNAAVLNKPSNNSKRSFTNGILKLDGLQIPKPGTYRFEVSIGDFKDDIELYASILNK